MRRRVMFSPVHPMQLVMGLIIWSLWFLAIYAGLSIACSVAPPPAPDAILTWINRLLFLLTFLTTVLLLGLAYRCWRAPAVPGNRHFVARVAAGAYLFAAASTLAVGLPALTLPPCL